jgi:hypothetical protein
MHKKKIENILLNDAYNPPCKMGHKLGGKLMRKKHCPFPQTSKARQQVEVFINILYNMLNGSPLLVPILAYRVCTV